MLTAFYMTRLMVMTFHGTNRTGAEEAKHLDEAPQDHVDSVGGCWPLLSTLGGWVNVTEDLQESILGGFGLLPMSEWLHHWLEPVTAAAHHVQETHLGEIAHSAPFGGGEVAWGAHLDRGGPDCGRGHQPGCLSSKDVAVATEDAVADRLRGSSSTTSGTWTSSTTGSWSILSSPLSRFSWRVIDAGIIDGFVNLGRERSASDGLDWQPLPDRTGEHLRVLFDRRGVDHPREWWPF